MSSKRTCVAMAVLLSFVMAQQAGAELGAKLVYQRQVLRTFFTYPLQVSYYI